METKKSQINVLGPIKLPILVQNGKVEDFKLYFFKSPNENYHILERGNVKNNNKSGVFVRIESACTYAHLYGSQLCDCKWQLDKALEIIANDGCGIIIYALDQHGRGIGLENHIKVYMQEQNLGLDTVEAHKNLGLKVDARDYSDIYSILKFFGIKKVKLLTNNPIRIDFLKRQGIEVQRIPLETKLNKYNQRELKIKKEKLGHLFSFK